MARFQGRRFRQHHIGALAVLTTLFWVCPEIPASRAATRTDATLPADTAATVNGQAIPQHLVDAFLKNAREALEINPATDEGRKRLAELPASILDELIDRTLVAQGARERGALPAESDIDADEKRMIEFCGSDMRYDQFVAQNGFDRKEYREVVLRTKAVGLAMIDSLSKEIRVSDDEVRAYHDAHAAEPDFQWPERITAAHILVNARPGVLASQLEEAKHLTPDTPAMQEAIAQETEARRQRAETLRQEALAPGADFAALARRSSDDAGTRQDGGSLGTFAHGVHPAALDDALFKLNLGEISPVIQTEYGFHVARVSAHLPAGRRTLAETEPEIRRRLLRAAQARRLREWLSQAREKADIVVRGTAS